MDVEQLEHGVFSNETLALLILNELRMTRKDMNAGIARLESKINCFCQDKNDFVASCSNPLQENPFHEARCNKNGVSESPMTRLFTDSHKVKKAKRNSHKVKKAKRNKHKQKVESRREKNSRKSKEIPVYTVHVDVNEFDEESLTEEIFEKNEVQARRSSSDTEMQPGILLKTNYKTFFGNDISASEDGRYHCDLCSSSYTSRGNLQRHYRSHTGEKRFKCPVCYRSFYRNEYLKYHMNRHTKSSKKRTVKGLSTKGKLESEKKEELFVCDICERTFTLLSNLERHMQIHGDSEPYGCKLCGEKFTEDDTLNSHMKQVHHY